MSNVSLAVRLLSEVSLGEEAPSLASLPYGSGFDERLWSLKGFKRNKNRFEVSTWYHAMNGDGYYCGWYRLRFVATIIDGSLWDLKVYGHSRIEKATGSYMKDYLLDELWYILSE